MLLSNITFHASLTPNLSNLMIPIISIPTPASDTTVPPPPPYFFPLSRSGSSTIHLHYRPEMEDDPASIPKVEAVRALVQAFEDGSAEGVAKGDPAKRKGTVHFLASVFANISMVSLWQTRRPLVIEYRFINYQRTYTATVYSAITLAPLSSISQTDHSGKHISGRRTPTHQDCSLHGTPGYDSTRRCTWVYQVSRLEHPCIRESVLIRVHL
jgi:hypothetical protein